VGGSNTINSITVYDASRNHWDELAYKEKGKKDPKPYRSAMANSFPAVTLA
jgi:hypothetical protein